MIFALHPDHVFHNTHHFHHSYIYFKNIRHSFVLLFKGNCLDNSPMENFFGKMKNEMFYGHEYEFKTLEQLQKAMEEYIEYYNNKRIQVKSAPPVTEA